MTNELMPSRLWEETRETAAAWGRAREPRADPPAASSSIQPGQVLVLAELGEPRLAWGVVRREAVEHGRLLLVAADGNPLVGTGDVAVAGSAVGSLTLRCRSAIWISERKLGATALLSTLSPEALSRVDSRCQAVAENSTVGSFSEQEAEEEPEYQDWIEDVVRPAVATLAALAGAEAPKAPSVLPFSTPRPALLPSPRAGWLRWAAVLAFVVLGAASGLLWWRQAREIAGLQAAAAASEAAHRRAIAELQARRAALEAQYRRRLQEAGADRARLAAEHQARMRELSAQLATLRLATAVKNPLLEGLDPKSVLRGPQRIEIGPEVSHLVLLLAVDDPAGTKFQIEVDEQPSGRQVFVLKGLQADHLGEVRPGIPAALLPAGEYRLRLFRLRGERLQRVHEYLIEIDKEGGR